MPIYLGSKKVSIQTNVTPEEPSVFIRDPYGNLIAEYIKDEFLLLEAYPTPPTLSGLTFQEYNWTLADAQSYVRDNGAIDIGATYTTTSGKNEIIVEVNKGTGLSISIASGVTGTRDWGDGTSDTATSHTYAQAGTYTITIDTTTFGSSGSNVFSQSNSQPNYTVKELRIVQPTSLICTFNYCYALRNIILSNTVTSITYSMAFGYCYKLENVVFSKSITSLASQLFYNDYNLSFVSLAKNSSLTVIPSGLFYSCRLKRFVIPNSITSIYGQAFYNTRNLESIIIPESVSSTDTSMFESCYALKKVVLPSTLTAIMASTFNYCYALESVVIKNGTNYIGNSAFSYCYNLKSISILNSATSLGVNGTATSIFENCYNLEEVSLPSSANVTSFSSTFRYCYKLKEITIPDSITTIGSNTFQFCSSLTELKFPSGLTSIQSSAFSNCSNMMLYDFSDCLAVPSLSSTNAFLNLNRSAKIVVPDSLYESWIATTNWANYADSIYKASEV